jgi:acyl dehydratase
MNWTVGQELKPLEKPEITRDHLKAYAAASGDHNLIHLDEKFAREAGFPGVIVHGMLSMAFMADHLIHNFPEASYKLLRLKTRFRKVTFPGDRLVCGGKVKSIQPDGSLLVSLWTTNQKGENTTEGEAELTAG